MSICRQALALARALQEAGTDPVERKRRLLAGLCEMVGARQAISAVTNTDLQTGVHAIQSVIAVRMVPIEPPTSQADASGPVALPARRRRPVAAYSLESAFEPIAAVDVSADAAQEEVNAGRCVDDFIWLNGLKLIGSVTFTRPVGAPRFAPRDRVLIELIHKQFDWIYTHDRWLADALVGMKNPVRQVLEDVVAGHDASAIARRWHWKPTVVRAAMESVWNHLGVQSREQLIAKWAVPFGR